MGFLTVRRGLVVLLAIACLGLANPVAARDDYAAPNPPSAAAMAVDLVLVRPLSLVATVLGSGLFFASLPLALLGMNVDQTGHRLVLEPAEYTFVRPLGNFQANSPRP